MTLQLFLAAQLLVFLLLYDEENLSVKLEESQGIIKVSVRP